MCLGCLAHHICFEESEHASETEKGFSITWYIACSNPSGESKARPILIPPYACCVDVVAGALRVQRQQYLNALGK